jgi:hypothetical protein
MSWNVVLAATDDDKERLQNAISDARRHNILMYCAASEKKATKSGNKYWPSSCEDTFSIGAASENRVAMNYVDSDAQFLFPSENVLANKRDGGSSAATALAAGLASLILFCLKKREKDTPTFLKQQPLLSAAGKDPRLMMEKVFETLSRDSGNGYVDIDPLFNRGKMSYGSITKHCDPYITPHTPVGTGTQKGRGKRHIV